MFIKTKIAQFQKLRYFYMCKSYSLLALDGCNTWQNLALDGLEQCTTTSRNVAHLVGQTELVDTSHRVTTANQ